MVHLLKKLLESGKIVSGISILRKDTYYCSHKYRCALDIYLMTVLSSSYGIIMDSAINSPVHENNIIDEINAMYKHYLKG